MIVKLWSAQEEKELEVEFTNDQHAALTAFVNERAEDGEFFSADDVDALMPPPFDNEGDERSMFDTTAIVQAFLPEGFGVVQDGYDDFFIEEV